MAALGGKPENFGYFVCWLGQVLKLIALSATGGTGNGPPNGRRSLGKRTHVAAKCFNFLAAQRGAADI